MNSIDILEEKEKRALENIKSLLLYSSEHEYFSPFKEEEIDDMNIVLNLVSTLIAENKELKVENKELKEKNKKWEELYDENQEYIIQLNNKIFQLETDNKKLDKENQGLFEAYNFNDINLFAKTLKEYRKEILNSVPKSKVEEEIDKLNKKEKDLQNSINDEEREEYSDANISFDLMDIDIRRETLQSLLGKE